MRISEVKMPGSRHASAGGTVTARPPYESLDPLTIVSCDDPSMVYREEISVELPRKNLWPWIKSDEPPAIADVTGAAP